MISDTKKPEKGQPFSTVTLPTAKLTLPKDISTQEMSGVPRKGRVKEEITRPQFSPITEVSETSDIKESKIIPIQTAQTTTKGTEPKFPELLIPEWKKQAHGSRAHRLEKVPSIDQDDVFDPDNEVFIPEKTRVVEQVVIPAKSSPEDNGKLAVDRSFDSSETSEDTLKFMSAEPSPAPRAEPPKFPTEVSVVKHQVQDPIETASDPGQSRPNSMIKVAVETHGTPLLLRKTNYGQQLRGRGLVSSRLNIPVIPMKQIKPAQELLDESQRYRSGHSIYLTRILKRYPMKIECRSRSLDEQNKENVKEGYVKQMVKQLSREGTPESRGSPRVVARGLPSVAKSESPKSEFVSDIVRKLSSPVESPERTISPLRDLTNGGQVQRLKQTYDSSEGIHERTYSESVYVKKRNSQDLIQPLDSSSSTSSTLTFSPIGTKAEPGDTGQESSKVIYSSMPMLSLEENELCRERSATTSSPSRQSHSPKDSPSQKHKIHVAISMSPGRSRRVIDPKLSPARMRRLIDPASPGRRRRLQESSTIEIVQEEPEATTVAQSQLSPAPIDTKKQRSPKSKRKEKSKMGTIEVLCRQSMTFDLGVSVQGRESASRAQGAEPRSQTLPIRHSTSSTTSADSEIEGAAGPSEERKKSRHKKFLDSAFIQKSKKFFKVSK